MKSGALQGLRSIHVPGMGAPSEAPHSAYCELDRWTFDPRYTGGRCPICGWEPPEVSEAEARQPAWVRTARELPWDLVGLGGLALSLLLLAILAGHLAGNF
ncbi:MAG: hypothetical protein ACYDAY_07435 [Candidatus Dormibacteria bacterium]